MPNRIIKETILTSPTINELSVYAERHFYRLLLCADDYGCFEATAEVIRGKCYPLQLKRSTVKKVEEWHAELEAQGILRFWEAEGRRYGIFMNFDKHNSKYCVTEKGKPTRHRRRTPEPPAEILASLCQDLPNPTPNPNPNPKHNHKTPTAGEANKYFYDTLGNYATDLASVIQDFEATRRGGKIQPSVIIKIVNSWKPFSGNLLLEAKKEWDEKRYAKEGMKENYFLGICRRLADQVEFRKREGLP